MFNYTNCPVCKETSFTPFISCKDHTVSKEEFHIVSCSSCGFKFTNPIPDPDKLGAYYKSEDYISHSNTKKGIISRLYHAVRNITLRQKLGLVTFFVPRGTLLDYGCGTGMFLNACKKAGWSGVGVEPDAAAREIGKEMGLEIYSSRTDLEGKTGRLFEAITLWHVLEHVTDLQDSIAYFRRALKPGGVLIIAVPNYLSLDAKSYGKFWAAYDVPRHLYHFDRETICKLMNQQGFTLALKKGMKFDSFYVSMLSEKYRTGGINYFKALFNGLRSNLAARASGNYSSLIYVFKAQ